MRGDDQADCPDGLAPYRSDVPRDSRTIAVVGGGASAVLLAAALSDEARPGSRPHIVVIEREEAVGPGLAYGRADGHHLLNSPAGRMGSTERRPEGFVEWSAANGHEIGSDDFAPRRLYGEYLVATFAELARSSAGLIRHVRDEAVSIDGEDRRWSVRLAGGDTVEADAVVLAVGNPRPGEIAAAARVIQDPWKVGALDGVGETDRVLLMGTGLTMVDIATSLARKNPGLRMTATSRSMQLPHTHTLVTADYESGFPAGREWDSLGSLVSAFGRELRSASESQVPWQHVVDAIRPQLGSLWSGLTLADRRRFLDHVARRWDVHRHRMAPAVSRELDDLVRTGRLRFDPAPDRESFDVVVNCTGPRSVAETGWNPAVDSLVASGLLRPEALGLGVDVDSDLRPRSVDGCPSNGLFALGPALKGAFWEATAIPEIRTSAGAIARYLTSGLVANRQLAHVG